MDEQAEGPEQMLLHLAAGDRNALLFFATLLMGPGSAIAGREALVAAECFASLAAADPCRPARRVLAQVQLRRSRDLAADDPERSEGYWWNAAALLFDLATEGDDASAAWLLRGLTERADLGNDEAAAMLNEVIEALSPALLTAARLAGEAMGDVDASGRSPTGRDNGCIRAGGPSSLAELLALASLAPGGGAQPPLPANPTAGGQSRAPRFSLAE